MSIIVISKAGEGGERVKWRILGPRLRDKKIEFQWQREVVSYTLYSTNVPRETVVIID